MAPPLCFDWRKSRKKEANGRLRIGRRTKTFKYVWYEPIQEAEPDEDGNIPMGFYDYPEGPAMRRAPMECEIIWLPEFDPKEFEANDKKGRGMLQMQFLWDLYRYLDAEDLDQVEQLEEEFAVSRDRDNRWHELFKEIGPWKHGRLEKRPQRRKERERMAAISGINAAEYHITSDTSDDDSAYGEGEEDFPRRPKAKSPYPMAPPSSPGAPKKRREPKQGRDAAAKRRRPNQSGGRKRKLNDRGDDEDLFASGGIQNAGAFNNIRDRSASVLGREDDHIPQGMFDASPAVRSSHRGRGGSRGGSRGAGISSRYPPQPTIENEDGQVAEAIRRSLQPETRPEQGPNGDATGEPNPEQQMTDSTEPNPDQQSKDITKPEPQPDDGDNDEA